MSDDELFEELADLVSDLPKEPGKESFTEFLKRFEGEQGLVWIPFNEDHAYWTHLQNDVQPAPEGFTAVKQWIAEDENNCNEAGKARRRYWIQLFRGNGLSKVLLTGFGQPIPKTLDDRDAAMVAGLFGFSKWQWEPVTLGVIWINEQPE